MTTRIDQLAENELVTRIGRLRSQLDAFKGPQLTSMASGVLGYASATGNTWDDERTVGTPGGAARATTYTMTFTGDGSQDIAFADLAFGLYANGHQLIDPSVLWSDGTHKAEFAINGLTISHHTYTLEVDVVTIDQVTLQFVMYAYGSQRGTLTLAVSES